MNVMDIKYQDNYFDFIIDKSTIDALLCGESSYLNVAIMLKEVQRSLKDDGHYMIISYGKPENRIVHLERPHLDFEIQIFTIKKDVEENPDLSKTHYVYLCKKNKNANLVAEKNFDFVCYELEQQELIDKEIFDEENDNNYDICDYDPDLYSDDENVENLVGDKYNEGYIEEEVIENSLNKIHTKEGGKKDWNKLDGYYANNANIYNKLNEIQNGTLNVFENLDDSKNKNENKLNTINTESVINNNSNNNFCLNKSGKLDKLDSIHIEGMLETTKESNIDRINEIINQPLCKNKGKLGKLPSIYSSNYTNTNSINNNISTKNKYEI